MNNYTIKATGNIDEVLTALKTMESLFGKDATLAEVAKATRYGRIETATRMQFGKED